MTTEFPPRPDRRVPRIEGDATTAKNERSIDRPLRVAIVARYFPHYRKAIFDRVASAYDGIQLEVLCTMLDKPLPGAGIAVPVRAPYARSVANWKIKIAGHTAAFQPAVMWRALTGRYDVMVFEAAVHNFTTIALIGLLRWTRTRTVAWTKGWFGPNDLDGLLGRLRRWLVRHADVCLRYGSETRKQLLTLGVPDERIAINQNAVEVDHLLNTKADEGRPKGVFENDVLQSVAESGATIVASIGRQNPDKRFDELIRAFAEISSNHPDKVLVLAGSGPEAAKLETLVRDLGMANVRLTGVLSPADAAELFRQSEICVFPGAVGLALNEAMAAGCATICADEPGPDSELCEHEVNGLRYPPGDHVALVAALERLLGNDAERRHFGAVARETIVSRATVQRMADAIVNSVLMARSLPRSRA